MVDKRTDQPVIPFPIPDDGPGFGTVPTGAPVAIAGRYRDATIAGAVTSDRQAIRNILVPLDGTAVAEAAIPHAVALVKATGAALHLIRVVASSPLTVLPSMATELSSGGQLGTGLGEAYLSQVGLSGGLSAADPVAIGATVYLEEIADRLRAHGMTVQPAVRVGPPGQVIATLATALGIDLLILASEPHSGLARLVAGSVADELLRTAPCPVMYVRTAPAPISVPTDGLRNFARDVARSGALTSVRLGMREVPVDRITGSVGRGHELNASFLPRRARKDDTARFKGVKDYYVLDGHHRVAAARQLGIRELEAEVSEYFSSSDAEQQQVFVERRAFERETGLTKVGASRVGTYPGLLALISVSPERETRLPGGATAGQAAREAWSRWYFGFFQGMQRSMRAQGLHGAFPGERSADILVRLAQFRESEARLGQEVSWEQAVGHFAAAYGRRPRGRGWSLLDLVPGGRG
ncbi:MAG: hypothetical protein EBT47_03740 [Chloroflexi bacterium]|nr:hypothetical protein [Chloroflexota bacterium]